MKAIFRGLSVSMIALVAAGCTTPNPTALDKPGDVPPAFTAPVADKHAPIWPEANWWVNFKADELPALMETAPEGKSRPRRRRRPRAAGRSPGRRRLLRPAAHRQSAGRRDPPADSAGSTSTNGLRRHRTFNSFSAGLAASYRRISGASTRTSCARRAKTCAPPVMPESVVGLTIASSVAKQYFTVLATARTHRHRPPEYRRRQAHLWPWSRPRSPMACPPTSTSPRNNRWSPPRKPACPA